MKLQDVPVLEEQERGCGFRKPRGLYFIQRETLMRACGKFPLPLQRCPTCDAGIKYSRGFTWINPVVLFAQRECVFGLDAPGINCHGCAMADIKERIGEKAGLLWIGKQHYKTPEEWLREADQMGVSRRIKVVPKGFKVGETWVFVAHLKGMQILPDDVKSAVPNHIPACIQAFKPEAVEYVCEGNETEEELDALVKRGFTPVRVKPIKKGPDAPVPEVIPAKAGNVPF